MLFNSRGVQNYIIHHIVDCLVKIYVHKDDLYYYATSGIDYPNPFEKFTQLISLMIRKMFNSHKLYTM